MCPALRPAVRELPLLDPVELFPRRGRCRRRFQETVRATLKCQTPVGPIVPLPKDVKAVLFDFDQTLIHLGADWEKLRHDVQGIARSFGVEFDDKWVLRGIGLTFKKLTDSGREHEAATFRTEAFRLVAEVEQAALANSHPIEKAREVLGELHRRGYRVAIVSNNNPKSITDALALFEFPPVDVVVGRSDGEPVKPSPIPIHKALTKLHLKPQEAVLIGDGESDVGAGKAAGVATVLFYPPGTTREIATAPAERIDDLGKLLDLLPATNHA